MEYLADKGFGHQTWHLESCGTPGRRDFALKMICRRAINTVEGADLKSENDEAGAENMKVLTYSQIKMRSDGWGSYPGSFGRSLLGNSLVIKNKEHKVQAYGLSYRT